MSTAKVAIVIPVFNALPYLRLCLNSIFMGESNYHLYLIDDQSDPPTKEYLDKLDSKYVTVIHAPGRCFFTATVNVGLFTAREEPWILILNSDIEFTRSNTLDALIDCAQRWHAGIVGCKLLNSNGTINHAGAYGIGFHYGRNELNTDYFEEREVEWVTGACMLIRRSVFDTIGYLDTRFVHVGSDREFCHRAKRYGYKTIYSPVQAIHHDEKSKDNTSALAVEHQHGRGVF